MSCLDGTTLFANSDIFIFVALKGPIIIQVRRVSVSQCNRKLIQKVITMPLFVLSKLC